MIITKKIAQYFMFAAVGFCLLVPKELAHHIFFENDHHHETIHTPHAHKGTVVEKAHTHCAMLNFDFVAAFSSKIMCVVAVYKIEYAALAMVFLDIYNLKICYFRGRAPPTVGS